MPTALLIGPCGQPTLADRALADAFSVGLPDWHIVAASLDPARAASPTSIWSRHTAPPVRHALRADAIVFGGGTPFGPAQPPAGRHPLGRLAATAALSTLGSASGHPVALVGVGAAALNGRGARLLARRALKGSRLLVLRDEESAAALVGAGVTGPLRVGADPSWVLLDPPLPAHHGGDSVHVIPSGLAGAAHGQPWRRSEAARLESLVRQLVSNGLSVELTSWAHTAPPGEGVCGRGSPDGGEGVCGRGSPDAAAVYELADRIGPPVQVGTSPATLAEAVEAMRSAAVVVTPHFHGLVAAGAAGAAAVAVAHQPTMAGLAARLRQPVVAPEADPAVLAQAVLAAAAAGGPDPAAVKHEIAKAEEGFRLLRVLLSGGKSEESDEMGALPLRPWR